MSDLVERVARAIRPTMWDSNEAARAAILEVAAWLAEDLDGDPVSGAWLKQHLNRQLEKETK